MNSHLVSVLTPVYNGALYLEACIESVVRQTYHHLKYVIVDNCSTDGSYELAMAAAAKDDRISVVRNDEHVGPVQNWNRSLSHVQAESRYVKFVHADDWLFDTCIERMVALADQNPEVGLVSAYRLEEDRVSLDQLPESAPIEPGLDTFTMGGRDVARAILMEHASVLGSPTATLLRVASMGDVGQYFATEYLHADKEAALRMLQHTNFGFIRQVLTYTRRHNESVTSLTNALDTRRQENLQFLKKFGAEFLSDKEYAQTLDKALASYYRFLAASVCTGKGNEFWQSHTDNLSRAGSPLSRRKLYRAFARRWLNPARAYRQIRHSSERRSTTTDSGVHGFLDMSRKKQPNRD